MGNAASCYNLRAALHGEEPPQFILFHFSHLLSLDFNFITGIQSAYLFRLLVLWYCNFARLAGVFHSLQLGLVTGN